MSEFSPIIGNEIKTFFDPYLKRNPRDFLCVYGGSLYKDRPDSDVDLFVVRQDNQPMSEFSLENITEFVRDMHSRLGRKVDEEVPFHNKLCYTVEELVAALCFSGFDVDDAKIIVPDIIKSSEFLSGPEIKARLVLNALTTPHKIFGEDLTRYYRIRDVAEDSITLLALGMVKAKTFSWHELYEKLTTGPNGEKGEMYLGYKDSFPVVIEYLEHVLERGVNRLSGQGILKVYGDRISRTDNLIDPRTIMQEACYALVSS